MTSPDTRRAYRELFFTTNGIAEYIGGVILQDETIRQSSSTGDLFPTLLAQQGIVPGIKVDAGVTPLAGCPDEHVTEGLDGLAQRVDEYYAMGARFAKWWAVFVLAAWGGREDNVPAAQRAFYHRARCDAAAANGQYSSAMEAPSASG